MRRVGWVSGLLAVLVAVGVGVAVQGTAHAAEQHAWAPIGTPVSVHGFAVDTTSFQVARNADGRPEYFMLDRFHGTVLHNWLQADGTWRGWIALLSDVSAFTVATEAGGRLRVFAVRDTTLVTIAQNCASCGWEIFPTAVVPAFHAAPDRPLLAGLDATGRLQVFLWSDGIADSLYRIEQTAPDGAFASFAVFAWTLPGNSRDRSMLQPTFAHNADGRPELFLQLDDAQGQPDLWHAWQWADGTWSGWSRLSAPSAGIEARVVTEADGSLAVYEGRKGTVRRTGQLCPNCSWSGQWTTPMALPVTSGGQTPRSLTIGRDADGRLEAFVISSGYQGLVVNNPTTVWHAVQQSPGGAWGDWVDFGPLTPTPTGPASTVPWGATAHLVPDGSGRLWYCTVVFTPRDSASAELTEANVWVAHQSGPNEPWA